MCDYPHRCAFVGDVRVAGKFKHCQKYCNRINARRMKNVQFHPPLNFLHQVINAIWIVTVVVTGQLACREFQYLTVQVKCSLTIWSTRTSVSTSMTLRIFCLSSCSVRLDSTEAFFKCGKQCALIKLPRKKENLLCITLDPFGASWYLSVYHSS